jgi:hypothetical protein
LNRCQSLDSLTEPGLIRDQATSGAEGVGYARSLERHQFPAQTRYCEVCIGGRTSGDHLRHLGIKCTSFVFFTFFLICSARFESDDQLASAWIDIKLILFCQPRYSISVVWSSWDSPRTGIRIVAATVDLTHGCDDGRIVLEPDVEPSGRRGRDDPATGFLRRWRWRDSVPINSVVAQLPAVMAQHPPRHPHHLGRPSRQRLLRNAAAEVAILRVVPDSVVGDGAVADRCKSADPPIDLLGPVRKPYAMVIDHCLLL